MINPVGTNFNDALDFVLKWEGGFVDNPHDRGGATNKGITQETYNHWRIAQDLPVHSVRLIDDSEVRSIYWVDYWIKGRCDVMSRPIAIAHFDGCVQHGVRQSSLFLQRAIPVRDDGVIGPRTLEALRKKDPKEITQTYINQRIVFYEMLAKRPGQSRFLKGWMNRIDSLISKVFNQD